MSRALSAAPATTSPGTRMDMAIASAVITTSRAMATLNQQGEE